MTNIKLTEEMKEKLITLGLKVLLEKIDLLDFPTPKPLPSLRKKWTPARLRKFRATMKRKKLAANNA